MRIWKNEMGYNQVASTLSVVEIEYNIVKPSIYFWLLFIHHEQFVASTIASFNGIMVT